MRTPDASGRRRFVGVLRARTRGSVKMEVDGQTCALALDGCRPGEAGAGTVRESKWQ